MLVFCSYKYNSLAQCLEKPTSSLTPQLLIPFNNSTKKGWCDFHKRWELVTIGQDNKMYFSCGLPVSPQAPPQATDADESPLSARR